MPIIDHSAQHMPEPLDRISSRSLVGSEHGAKSLTVTEVVIHPGFEGPVHTHPTDEAIMVTEGSIQMVVGDETSTVRRGYTLLAPPGVPHKLVNNTWVAATMLVICPTDDLETRLLE